MDKAIDCPLVTVLMPVYNAEQYVEQAIQSVLLQTYSNFELLIINDGSSDKSGQIIESFKDERIRYFKNDRNSGLIFTLNKGIEQAQGKYIARMDADDIALPNRLEVQTSFMEKNSDVGVFGTAYQEFNHKGKEKTVRFLQGNDELKCVLLFNSCMGHPTVMFRTAFIKNNHLKYDSGFVHAEDYELWTRAIGITKFSNYPAPLLLYRLHDGQTSISQSLGQQSSAEKIRLNMLHYLNLKPTAEELKIQNALGNKEVLKGFDEIIASEKWFKKIIASNQQVKFIDPPVLNRYLSIIFQDVCANAAVGLKAFFYFNNSEIKNYSPKSLIFKFKFFIKCLIR